MDFRRSIGKLFAHTDAADLELLAPPQAYALATLLTVATVLLRLAIALPTATRPLLILFMLPITLSAFLGGAGAGLLATALTVVGEIYLVLGSGLGADVHPGIFAFQLGILVASGVLVSLVSAALHRARKRAELALKNERDARAEYRVLSDQMRDPMWRKDGVGRYLDCNAPFRASVQRTREEILGQTDAEIFTGAALAQWTAADLQVMATLQPVETEEYWPAPSFKGWMLVTRTPVLDAAGRCVGSMGIARDINRRRASERALQESEALFRTLFEIDQDAVFISPLHDDGHCANFVEANAEALRLFGYGRAALSSTSLADLIDTAAGEDLHALLREVARHGRAQRVSSARAADGRHFPIEISIIAFRPGNAGSYAAMTAIRDISARVHSEAEQSRLYAQVAQMQKLEAIGQLTGGIAHDFNNLLATMLGYTELASRHAGAAGDVKLEQYLAAIGEAGERGRDLISKLLSCARPAERDLDAVVSAVAPRAVLNGGLELLRAVIPSSIALDVQLDEFAGGVSCDAVALDQLLLNLVINARDAIEGVGCITIRLWETGVVQDTCVACLQDYSGEFVELAVSDSGAGIPAHLMPKIFQPFFTTKDVGKGTGLGLALINGIVHQSGGHIQINGNSGTTVRLRLPRVSLPGATSADLAAPALRVHGSAGQRSGHVMVIDDEAALGRYWRELLEGEGYRVSIFSDPRAALRVFAAQPEAIDAVLSDLTMPHLTGEQLARSMLLSRPTLPVFLLSGNLVVVDSTAMASLGVRQCFKKPVNSAAVLAALAAALHTTS